MDGVKDEMEFVEPTTSKPSRRRKSIEKYNPAADYKSQDWTEDEKMKLAKALQIYGHLDIDKLHEEINTKTCEQIKQFVLTTLKKSRICYADFEQEDKPSSNRMFSKSPIDQWLRAFENSQASLRDEWREYLGKALMYISRFEPHPDPSECGGVDYAAAYEFLYHAINGYPVKAVNPQTAAVILEELDNLYKSITGPGNEKEKEHLGKVKRLVFVENATKRHYGRKEKENKSSRPIERLLDVKGFNPLSIPYDLLNRKTNSE